MTARTVAEIVARHLSAVLRTEDFDLIAGADDLEFDLAADDWTLHVEDALAFLAIEHEPEDDAEIAPFLSDALSARVLAAISAADRDLGGELRSLLRASGDPLSIRLADAFESGPTS